jgi:hypothetical protein
MLFIYWLLQEMLSICLFMQDSSRADMLRYMDGAISSYLTKCNSTLHALRATLFGSDMLRRKGYPRESVWIDYLK